MLRDFVALDLETTGIDCQTNEIIEVGLVKVTGGSIESEYQSLVRAGRSLPVKIKRLTGITDDELARAPGWAEIRPAVLDLIANHPLVGHNIYFDLGFLNAALGYPLTNSCYDTLALARLALPASSSHRLASLCQALQIGVGRSHRALADARAAARIALELQEKLTRLEPGMLVYLNKLLQQAGSPWQSSVADLLRAKTNTAGISLSPLPPGLTRETIQPKPLRQSTDDPKPLDLDALAGLLEPGGKLESETKSYEYRPQQVEMARQIATAFNHNEFLLAEAGTGTGKSIAYLIPAMLWAYNNHKRVIISTHTINLQEQLWRKDVPQLRNILNLPVKTALVKGRQNYLCISRWVAAISEPVAVPAEEAAFLARVLIWLNETETGDRSELNLQHREREYWQRLCSDNNYCKGGRCPWFHYFCFTNTARRKAEGAHLVIANHSLLLTDARPEHRVLPQADHLIIDEAHHLEEAATNHLGYSATRHLFLRWLGSLSKLLRSLGETAPPLEAGRYISALTRTGKARNEFQQHLHTFFDRLAQAAQPEEDKHLYQAAVRLNSRRGDHPLTLLLAPDFANLATFGKGLLAELKVIHQLLEICSSADEIWLDRLADITRELTAGAELLHNLEFIWLHPDENYTSWLEKEQDPGGGWTLRAAPVLVGEILYHNLYQHKDSVILTSATLTVNNSFAYFMQRAGLDLLPQNTVRATQIDSPFAYDEQCLFCVVQDLPGPGPGPAYQEAIAGAIQDLVVLSGGNSLVLFTSHHMLRETYRLLKPRLEEHDICLLGHNIDGGRSRLVEEFSTTPRAVLLGTSSFWEGVDIPGPALTNLIIVKLPFWPPNTPVNEARLEMLAGQGQDGFKNLSLPQAVIRFKQGFGRLIRSTGDQGVVIVLDSRLIAKKYGRSFLDSLPLKKHIRGDARQICKKVSRWLALLENNGVH